MNSSLIYFFQSISFLYFKFPYIICEKIRNLQPSLSLVVMVNSKLANKLNISV